MAGPIFLYDGLGFGNGPAQGRWQGRGEPEWSERPCLVLDEDLYFPVGQIKGEVYA